MPRLACVLFLAPLILTARLFAAAPVYTNNFVSVTLDGVRLGTNLDPSNYSMFPTVVYDSGSGLFHMWVFPTSTLSLEAIRHATSSDGVHFISTGDLSFAGGNPFPVYGAPAEPGFEFPRAAKLGTDWKLLLWTENGPPGQNGDYNYNESINDIGIDPSTLAVTHQGPIYPTNGLGTYGQTTGPYGIVDGRLYVADDRIGGLSKWEYNDTTPPSVTPPADTYQDLITGTGYVYFLTHPGDPLGVYVHNVGRVLDQGDGTLGVYYSLRHPDGSRVNRQIYYSQSGDGGQTWSAPVGIFAWGDAVTVDGGITTEFFSHPEVTLVGTRRVLYFSTKADDGAFVVATSAAQPTSLNGWSLLLGSGQLYSFAGGDAVVRVPGGGYAVAGSSGVGDFALIGLDETGDVVWQRAYTGTGGGYVTGLVQAADGGFVVSGSTIGNCSVAWVVKTDPLGNVVWANSYATNTILGCANVANGMVQKGDGSLAIAGRVASAFGLIQLSSSGALQKSLSYRDGMPDSAANALVEAGDGGFAIAGYPSSGFTNHHLYWVIRTDAAGAPVWYGLRSGGQDDTPSGIANRPGGGVMITGFSRSYGGAWTLAYDPNGNLDWEKVFTLPESAHASGIVPSGPGSFGIAGRIQPDSGFASQALLFEVTDAGAVQWGRQFAAQVSSTSLFVNLTSTLDGGLLAVGRDAPFDSRVLAVKVDAGGGFVGCLDDVASVQIAVSATSGSGTNGIGFSADDMTANTTVTPLTVTSSVTDVSTRILCRDTLPAWLAPAALACDPSGNGVADPGESFATSPAWTNQGDTGTIFAGHASPVSDSNGLDTSDPDGDASYGDIASHATVDCLSATGDCYQFRFQNVPRPAQHWDGYFDETISSSDPHHTYAKRWTVHAGLSFSDVSASSGYYRYIEDIFHNGITGGCGAGIYCPTGPVTRAQMAVFLLKSKHGSSFVPPPCAGVFGDVACPSLFADWIEELAAEQITAGCSASPLLYCPSNTATRQQMAVFLLKALNGSSYVPPPCQGFFGDVPCSSPFSDWIYDLFNRGITAGCNTNPPLYCPTDANTRQQMAVFLTKTFSLLLYGP